ncbi:MULTISPECIES: exonuclease SbcCD subunit D [unclassified Meiothermus]|uniref:metallophosphoesterase family protein n=1 Tax=unclassified Meiothermus TaxID=370471 RepID=UPI000D7C1A2E|nr:MULTISPECIES: exonuclease SbcCD subunit D [unclassified Meiothermus]PZA07985.1 exonuclease SbcCD subunit D [Meiothermus sp. Pnk-1]RYM35330.1 exonuclease SbcCD subunit D [Meiothermus sp. PNK-Is4]
MRILHTADWHLGKLLKGTDRTPEIAAALEELVSLVRSERVELVLVAGDLFDRPQVSAEAEAAAFGFFHRLHELQVPAWVIAGNHDPRERLEALAPLLALAGTTVRGEVRLSGQGGVVCFPGGQAALLPFLSERRLVKAQMLLEGEGTQWKGIYADGMRRVVDNLCAGMNAAGVKLIMGHLTVEGSRLGGGEFQFYCSNSYAVSPSIFPTSLSYVALGHIHRQQQVSEAPVAWYPGSLVQLDFGEGENAPRGALLIEVEPGTPPRVHPVEARWGKPLKTFRIKLEHLERRLDELATWGGYAKLVLEGRGNAALRERLFKEFPGLLEVEFHTPESAATPPVAPMPEELDWADTYTSYVRDTYGGEPDEALLSAFRQVYEEVHAAEAAI